MTVLYEISTSRSQENVLANQSSIIESLPVSPIPDEDSEPVQEEIDIFLVLDDFIPPGIENDDSEDEDNKLPNLDHQDNPSIPRPPPEPPDVEKCLEPEAGFDLPFSFFLHFLHIGSEDTIFDPDIITFPFSYLSWWHFNGSLMFSSVAIPKENECRDSSELVDSVKEKKQSSLRGVLPAMLILFFLLSIF
ncbi:hypothetical protein Tco_1200962 [Tanacetum coccineum]